MTTQKRQIDWLPALFLFFSGGVLYFVCTGGPWWRWVGGFVAVFLAYFAGILRGLEAQL